MITKDEIDKLIIGESVIRIWSNNTPKYYLLQSVIEHPHGCYLFRVSKDLSTNENVLIDFTQEQCDVVSITKEEWKNRVQSKELQELLVQCCIDYFNTHENKDVEEICFTIDSLQASIENKKWHPYSDSYISLNGISDDGRVTLAEYM